MINTLPPEILIPIIHDVLLYTVSTANGHIGDFSSMVLSSMEEPIWGPTVDLDETDNPYALATLGPLWQSGIESLTFSKLVLTPDRVREALAGHYLSPRRLSYVRRIDYSIPIAVNKGPAASDTTDSDAFTAGVADLLRLIGGPPQLIPSADPHIQLNISIPMDHTIFVNTESVNKLDLLGKARVEASMIAEGHLRVSHIEMNEGVLATVPNIPTVAQMFIKSHSNSLLIVPRSAVLIAAKATRLRHVRLHLDDNEKRDAALRIKLRNGTLTEPWLFHRGAEMITRLIRPSGQPGTSLGILEGV